MIIPFAVVPGSPEKVIVTVFAVHTALTIVLVDAPHVYKDTSAISVASTPAIVIASAAAPHAVVNVCANTICFVATPLTWIEPTLVG